MAESQDSRPHDQIGPHLTSFYGSLTSQSNDASFTTPPDQAISTFADPPLFPVPVRPPIPFVSYDCTGDCSSWLQRQQANSTGKVLPDLNHRSHASQSSPNVDGYPQSLADRAQLQHAGSSTQPLSVSQYHPRHDLISLNQSQPSMPYGNESTPWNPATSSGHHLPTVNHSFGFPDSLLSVDRALSSFREKEPKQSTHANDSPLPLLPSTSYQDHFAPPLPYSYANSLTYPDANQAQHAGPPIGPPSTARYPPPGDVTSHSQMQLLGDHDNHHVPLNPAPSIHQNSHVVDLPLSFPNDTANAHNRHPTQNWDAPQEIINWSKLCEGGNIWSQNVDPLSSVLPSAANWLWAGISYQSNYSCNAPRPTSSPPPEPFIHLNQDSSQYVSTSSNPQQSPYGNLTPDPYTATPDQSLLRRINGSAQDHGSFATEPSPQIALMNKGLIRTGKRKAILTENDDDNLNRRSKFPRLAGVSTQSDVSFPVIVRGSSTTPSAPPLSSSVVLASCHHNSVSTSNTTAFNGPPSTGKSLVHQHCSRGLAVSTHQRALEAHHSQENAERTQGGIFPNAQNFTVNNPTMIHVQNCDQSREHRETLEWLENYILEGAELDSSERSPPPKCHPNTRVSLVQKANDWFKSPPDGKRLLWLRGLAGVGKSAIIQTLAEGWRDEDRLGASLFFSRERRHTDPTRVFPALAYQMALRDPAYARYIGEDVRRDARSLNKKALDEQFRVLFTIPFVHKKVRSNARVWVITLDGLDECGEDEQKRRHRHAIQVEFIKLIGSFASQHPTVPLVWIIASRPEAHLKAVFDASDIRDTFLDVEVPADSEEACQDVEKFLDTEFKKIREQYPDVIPDPEWPTHRQFVNIAKVASGLFVFAATIIRFIADPHVENPVEQLKWVILTIGQLLVSGTETNPLAFLDKIYYEIISRVSPKTLPTTRQILGAVMSCDSEKLARKDGWTLSFICEVFHITPDSSMTALRHLHSVLVMSPKRTNKTRPAFYHTSFRDFLADPARSQTYSIGVEDACRELKIYVAVWVSRNSPLSSKTRIHYDPFDSMKLLGSSIWSGSLDLESSTGIRLQYKSVSVTISYPDFQQLLECVVIDVNALRKILQKPANIRQEVSEYDFFVRRQFFQETTLGMMELDLARARVINFKYNGFFELHNNWWSSGSEQDKFSCDFCSRVQNHPLPIPVLVIGKVFGKRGGLIQASVVRQFWNKAWPCWIWNL